MENVWFVSSFVTQRRKTTEQFDCDIYYFVVDLGMAFVGNLVVGKEKGCYLLSNDIVGLVGSLAM